MKVSEEKDKQATGISRAWGDVIRALLMKPADEVGSLVGDAIGIFGDRVKIKREQNVRLALEDTGKKLSAQAIDLKDITPPDEESLHTVIYGMSLASDEKIRQLWSSILAKAVNPNNDTTIQRPVTNVLEALSPVDARIIEIGAFVIREKQAIRTVVEKLAGTFGKEPRFMSDHYKETEVIDGMPEVVESFMEKLKQKLTELDISEIGRDKTWPDNLIRLGIIMPAEDINDSMASNPFRDFDVRRDDLSTVINYFNQQIGYARTQATSPQDPKYILFVGNSFGSVSLGFKFTRFGEKFCRACGLI